ncbi:unnamed protein product [Ectocarpus fasciculatus]
MDRPVPPVEISKDTQRLTLDGMLTKVKGRFVAGSLVTPPACPRASARLLRSDMSSRTLMTSSSLRLPSASPGTLPALSPAAGADVEGVAVGVDTAELAGMADGVVGRTR